MKPIKSLFLLLLLISNGTFAQKKQATVSGLVSDENNVPLAKISVTILGRERGTVTNDSGRFELTVASGRAFALVFTSTGFKELQYNLLLAEGENETINIVLEQKANVLQNVTVTDNRSRRETGLVNINAKQALLNPSPLGNIESLIKVFVGSNNELTSQYNVRGGSYDENLIYVNDFEVYRPYLVRSGQQEGLSFINPEMTSGVKFYNGGFQARYGDKMSSVLDVTYNKPTKSSGSAYVGLLEQGLHLEGISNNKQVTYVLGFRNRSNRNLVSSQETTGNYVPSSADMQALITWRPHKKWLMEALGNLSQTKFTLFPESGRLTASVFSPVLTANLGVDIDYEGQERDKYSTNMLGLSATYQATKNLSLKAMLSRFENDEVENIDITAFYVFGERNFDRSSADFGSIVNVLGAGVYQTYSRNKLNINVVNASVKGELNKGKHFVQFGNSIERQTVNDRLNEWQFNDSVGYSLPYSPNVLELNNVLKANAQLTIDRFSGYVQDNIQFRDSSDVTLQLGVRYNYNTLNNELLVSPRVGLSFKPRRWKKDIIFKMAGGAYNQPPFYRELRRYNGTINRDLKAQKSLQVSGGFDYSFRWLDRPARVTTEVYYKNMTDVVPYDIDNVRLRYSGENNAKAYAAGIEMRFFGELVKDAESWVSIGLMRTKEDLQNDSYFKYTLNDSNVPIDSSLVNVGYVRRPTDRMITFGMFFQDYLSTNKNIKVFLNTLYGSNLPYNIPNSVRYRNALTIDPYIRVDLGLSALLLDSDRSKRRSHNPFMGLENIWATLEIFNLIDRPNTISYLLLKDFANNTFTLPNRLTPRLLNLKLIVRW